MNKIQKTILLLVGLIASAPIAVTAQSGLEFGEGVITVDSSSLPLVTQTIPAPLSSEAIFAQSIGGAGGAHPLSTLLTLGSGGPLVQISGATLDIGSVSPSMFADTSGLTLSGTLSINNFNPQTDIIQLGT